MPIVDTKTREQIVKRVLTARKNRAEFLLQMKKLQQQGWQVARQTAATLKEEFGANRVVLFGSMLDHQHMTWYSDIDLAVWGLETNHYLRAGAVAERGHHFSIDLIDAELSPPHIQAAIQQGIEL